MTENRTEPIDWRAFPVILVAVAVLAAGIRADEEIDSSVRSALARALRFSAADFSDLERGGVVRRSIDTGVPGEIAVAGAIRIAARKSAFLERLRDIVTFKRGPNVVEIGRFSEPPSIDDLAGLSIKPDDFDVRHCRVGDCGIRLPASHIERFQREVNASAPDSQERGASLLKRLLLDHVAAYRSGNDAARMLQFDDGEVPIRPVDEFNHLLERSPFVPLLPDGALDRLRQPGGVSLGGPDDFLYWSKEQFGVGTFISVTRVTVTCAAPRTCVVITRDVYSSRFVDASLAVAVATDSAAPNAFFLIYANQSRAHALKGRLSGLRKTIASRRARQSLEDSLKTIKKQLEQP